MRRPAGVSSLEASSFLVAWHAFALQPTRAASKSPISWVAENRRMRRTFNGSTQSSGIRKQFLAEHIIHSTSGSTEIVIFRRLIAIIVVYLNSLLQTVIACIICRPQPEPLLRSTNLCC